ncbi:MAG TPA: ribbon-helix-helix protein, CopG family [Aggregatilineales bacterium]|nr:ribbon-helix-helix protein, CopG family [Aggregatilineales bacterium]
MENKRDKKFSKHPTSIRLSERAKLLMERLADKLGISQSAVIEIAIRALADREKVE